jgi:hypothetical protein
MKQGLRILIILLICAAKLSAQDSLFVRSYGLTGYNYGEKIIQDADSGFFILGNKSGFVGNTDVYLLKTDKYGSFVWDKAYGGSEVNWAEDFIRTQDKGFVMTGYITVPENNNDYDIMLLKTDSAGTFKWMKHYGGSDWDMAHSLVQTPDSGFLMTGETFNGTLGNNDVFILKTDKNGDSLWMKTYGGPNTDVAYDISSCHDGNFILTGSTNSFGHGRFDAYLLKINGSGDTLWSKTYGDTLDDKAFSGIETNNHGFAMTGSTYNFNAMAQDGIIFKADSTGALLWQRVYGGSDAEEFYDIIEKSNSNLFIAGYTMSSGYVGTKEFTMTLTDNGGWFINGSNFGGNKEDVAYGCTTTLSNGFVAVGTTTSMGLGLANILMIKADSMAISNTSTYEHFTEIHENSVQDILIYPNPVYETLTVSLSGQDKITEISVYDFRGERLEKTLSPEKNSMHFDFRNYSAGLYIIEIQTSERCIRKKIIHCQ